MQDKMDIFENIRKILEETLDIIPLEIIHNILEPYIFEPDDQKYTEINGLEYNCEFMERNISENCWVITYARQVGWCGNVRKRYNVVCDPCCWAVLEIKEIEPDTELPSKPWNKGYFYGLTVWDILQDFTHDM